MRESIFPNENLLGSYLLYIPSQDKQFHESKSSLCIKSVIYPWHFLRMIFSTNVEINVAYYLVAAPYSVLFFIDYSFKY